MIFLARLGILVPGSLIKLIVEYRWVRDKKSNQLNHTLIDHVRYICGCILIIIIIIIMII